MWLVERDLQRVTLGCGSHWKPLEVLKILARYPNDAEGQQLPQSLQGSAADWISAAASIELVRLHFAIHRYYHSLK